MNHEKRIVCDLDDTISVTLNRDWDNSKPVTPVIEKINELHENGWEIIILTARGQLSCGGDYKKADDKYRKQIESWLEKHKVKYDKLSFNKILGAYYVDDKALKPQEFADLKVERLYGMSGSYVLRQNDLVYKTQSNAIDVIDWYKKAEALNLPVPKVHKLVGGTITMDYIEKLNDNNISKICDQIETYKNIKLNENNFDVYINRLIEHIDNANLSRSLMEFLPDIDYMNENKSFCHGDASIDNFITSDKKIYNIDPIYNKNDYTSWLLDISKLSMSCERFNIMFGRIEGNDYMRARYKNIPMKSLELTHWIRFYKYTDDKKLCLQKIEGLCDVI